MYIDHQILPKEKDFEIVDAAGNKVPAQAGEVRSDGTYWYLYVRNVPALGCERYFIKVKDAPRHVAERTIQLADTHIENDWYAVDFNLQRGTIKHLFDKELNCSLLTDDAKWELGEFVYEIIDSRHPMEKYQAPQFLRRSPEKSVLNSLKKEKYGILIASVQLLLPALGKII